MTLNALIQSITPFSPYLVGFFLILPMITLIFGRITGPVRGAWPPYCYIYSIFVYLACIPGIFAGVLTAYAVFFLRSNLLNVNFVIYFLPLLSMIVTLIMIKKHVDMDKIPGFDRLYGLFIVLGISFILALAILKLRIWVFFGGGITSLAIIATSLFLLLKWGSHLLFRNRKEKKLAPPRFRYR